MNKELMKARALELPQRGLTSWGRVAPELFTFENQRGRETVRHG